MYAISWYLGDGNTWKTHSCCQKVSKEPFIYSIPHVHSGFLGVLIHKPIKLDNKKIQ